MNNPMTVNPLRCIPLAALALLTLAACDELPSNPSVPDRLRVVLVAASQPTASGTEWLIYEIDEEGTIEQRVRSTEPITDARYTTFLGTRGSISYSLADSSLVIHHLESGEEEVIEGPLSDPRSSLDGRRIAYSGMVQGLAGSMREQVFVIERTSGEHIQITIDECQPDGQVPDPCAYESSRPIFGENNELYMVRRLRSANGAEQVTLSVVSTSLIESRYFFVPAGTREIYPNSYFEGAVLADYVENEGTANEVRGFYVVRTNTGDRLDNELPLRDANFCYDATIVGVDGSELRFVTVAGEEVHRVQLPAGQEIVSVDCSFQSKNIDR